MRVGGKRERKRKRGRGRGSEVGAVAVEKKGGKVCDKRDVVVKLAYKIRGILSEHCTGAGLERLIDVCMHFLYLCSWYDAKSIEDEKGKCEE